MKTNAKLLGLTVLTVSLVLLAVSQSVTATPNKRHNTERAQAAYEALQQYFYEAERKLYGETYPHKGGNRYSYVWPFASAMQATVALARIPEVGERYAQDVQDRLDGLAAYWNGSKSPPGYDSYVRPPLGGGGDLFYDDNEWLAIELIKAYRLTGNEEALERAKELFALFVHGWDADESHPCSGGVFWTQAPWSQDRNTVSNAPAAEVGLYLYEMTNDSYYLDWAKKMYDWVNGCLLAPNGLYWDHIKLSGEINKTHWTYNQGTMIGASVLLYRATGDQAYLDRAAGIAEAALNYYGKSRIYAQPIVFNSIFFENLLLLDDARPNPKYRKYIQDYADEIWTTIRDPQTGLLVFDADRSTELLEQSAFAAIYANLAGYKRNGRN